MIMWTMAITLYEDADENDLPACWESWRIVAGAAPGDLPEPPVPVVYVTMSDDDEGFCVEGVKIMWGERQIYGDRKAIAAEVGRFINRSDQKEWVLASRW